VSAAAEGPRLDAEVTRTRPQQTLPRNSVSARAGRPPSGRRCETQSHGDCIAGTAWLEAGTGGGAGDPGGWRPAFRGARAFRDGVHAGMGEAVPGPTSTGGL